MTIFTPIQLRKIREFQDNALDSLSKPCKVWYLPRFIDCTNCLAPVDSRYSNNAGIHGGPLVTLCDLCNGTHKIQQEVTNTLNLEIDWTPQLKFKDYQAEGPNVSLSFNYVIVKGYLSDLPKLQQAIEIQLDTNNLHTNARYIRTENPTDGFNVIQGRYFCTILKRVS